MLKMAGKMMEQERKINNHDISICSETFHFFIILLSMLFALFVGRKMEYKGFGSHLEQVIY